MLSINPLLPVLSLMGAFQVGSSPTPCAPVGLVVWITGAPGVGKTTFMKQHILKAINGTVNLDQWPVHKEGTTAQLVWHTSCDGRVAIAGVYTFPSDDRFPKHRRSTSPANGGTDVLQPQCRGLLARLLRGELRACGRAPAVVIVEACARAKVGGPLVQEAMLAAREVLVLELSAPESVAVSRLRARDHSTDGNGVAGVAVENVHARYAAEVCELKSSLLSRARALGASVEWRSGEPAELVDATSRMSCTRRWYLYCMAISRFKSLAGV